MAEYRVTHKTFGDGIAQVDGDYIKVKFSNETKSFLLRGFNRYFRIQDDELLKLIQEAGIKETAVKPVAVATQLPQAMAASTVEKQSIISPNIRSSEASSHILLGPRSQTIHVHQ